MRRRDRAPGLTAAEREARWYGQFSFRTGNIYTAAALRQWLAWAFEESPPPDEAWEEDGRFYDPHRPAVEPDGHVTPEAVRAARQRTLAAIRTAVSSAGCLIFTLGLTEAWLDAATGIAYPVCPGTVRGSFDAGRHVFHNFTVAEVHRDLTAAVSLARRANPGLRVLLTVSPVPLTATATASTTPWSPRPTPSPSCGPRRANWLRNSTTSTTSRRTRSSPATPSRGPSTSRTSAPSAPTASPS